MRGGSGWGAHRGGGRVELLAVVRVLVRVRVRVRARAKVRAKVRVRLGLG